MDLKSLNTEQLAAETARREQIARESGREWQSACNATKAARRAETPLRKRHYQARDAVWEAHAEHNRREEILRNVGR